MPRSACQGLASAGRSTGMIARSGTETRKLLPTINVLSTSMVPPINSTRCLLMARPSPVPPKRRAIESSPWRKGLNSCWICGALMPIPLSRIVKRTCTRSGSADSSAASTSTSPVAVNLTALPARLISTCSRRVASPSSRFGTSGARRITTSSGLFCVIGISRLATRCSMSSSENSVWSSVSLPASILEKSSTSLTMCSSRRAASSSRRR